jgi:SAM-dependent methyltransferase
MHFDSKLREYYTRRSEAERLGTREGHLEHARSKELIARYLPDPPMRIIDIGGGTGTYASWLASLGYDVHMVDVMDGHVEAAAAVGSFTAAVGDARALEASANSYDGALLLGPLYHLPKRDDRLLALREVVRVVRPGGVVIAAFISRLAIPLDAYVKGWIDMERGLAGLSNAVQIGHDADGGFGAIAYFHLPSEISPELLSAGLEVQHVLGVEGPGWIAPDFDGRWADPGRRQAILDCARQCEALPELLGLSPHIIAIARNA